MFSRLIVQPGQAPFFPDLLVDLHRFRKRVFVDGLGWPLTVHSDGGERDSFDDDTASHIALVADRQIRAYCRLNPADRGLLLSVFPEVIDGPGPDMGSAVECARFAVDPELAQQEQRLWSARLLWAASLAAQARGAREMVSLSDPVMERVVRRIGAAPQRLGAVHKSAQGHRVLALKMAIGNADIARLAARAGLPAEAPTDMDEMDS